MRKFNRFGSRTPTFICQVCDRRTRDTGQGVDHLCTECFDIAGLDNMVNDNGYEPGSAEYASARAECDRLLAAAIKKGSNGDKIMASNGYVWPDVEFDSDPVAVPAPTDRAGWTRDKVEVNGVVYGSTRKAWTALGLPKGACGKFRKELKAWGAANYGGYNFKIVK